MLKVIEGCFACANVKANLLIREICYLEIYNLYCIDCTSNRHVALSSCVSHTGSGYFMFDVLR